LVSLTGVSGANPVVTGFRADVEGRRTGNWRSLFQVSILRVSNLFKKLEFMRGAKEVNRAQKDREPGIIICRTMKEESSELILSARERVDGVDKTGGVPKHECPPFFILHFA
jgi:hypothetical protein